MSAPDAANAPTIPAAAPASDAFPAVSAASAAGAPGVPDADFVADSNDFIVASATELNDCNAAPAPLGNARHAGK